MDELSALEAGEPVAFQHSVRFRKVANRFPFRVAEAYDDDITAAALDTDEQVAQRVAEWERQQGMEPRDWIAVGESEGRGDDEEEAFVEKLLRDHAEHPELYEDDES